LTVDFRGVEEAARVRDGAAAAGFAADAGFGAAARFGAGGRAAGAADGLSAASRVRTDRSSAVASVSCRRRLSAAAAAAASARSSFAISFDTPDRFGAAFGELAFAAVFGNAALRTDVALRAFLPGFGLFAIAASSRTLVTTRPRTGEPPSTA
jgi:hypothetical protein